MKEILEELIEEVRSHYKPLFEREDERFLRWRTLWRQFDDSLAAWRNDSDPSFQHVSERINELAAAAAILNDGTLNSFSIEYEPTLGGTEKSLDFCATNAGKRPIYIEVKTVRPQLNHQEVAAKRHQDILKFLPENNVFLMGGITADEDGTMVEDPEMGDYLAYIAYGSRAKFLEYTLEVERKIELIPNDENARVMLLFCSDGFSWHLDELEDFADFYRTGTHRKDDPYSIMEAHHIGKLEERGVSIARTIEGFCFLERSRDEALPSQTVYPVKGMPLT